MTVTKELICKLLSDHGIGDLNLSLLAGHLAKELNRIEDAEKRIKENTDKRQKEEEKHKLVLAALDQELSGIQSDCPHFSKSYHSDLFMQCNICKTLCPK